jgi:ketosteroid isomerase-like protein
MPRLTKPLLFASPEECEQAFYEALEAADADAVTELLLEDDETVCVHPGGPRLTGFEAVRESWAAILASGPIAVRSTLAKALETPTIALHNVIEEVVVGEGRRQQVVSVIATNAYVKTPAGWKMVLHHASAAPDGQPTTTSETHGILH